MAKLVDWNPLKPRGKNQVLKYIVMNFFILISFLFVLQLVEAKTNIELDILSGDDIGINQLAELIQIKGNDVEVEYVFKMIIRDMDLNVLNPELDFYFIRAGDRYFTPEIKEYMACQPDSGIRVGWQHSYDHIGLEHCNNSIKVNFSMHGNWRHSFAINKGDIKLHNPYYTPLYFRIKLIYPNFIIKRPDQRIFWQDLSVSPEPASLERYLVTEEDSLILSLLNYRIERYRLGTEKFILSFKELGETQVIYKSYKEEKSANLKRDFLIIFITLSLSLIFAFFYSDKRLSKRTKNLCIFTGCFLLASCAMLLSGANNNWFLTLLVLFLILSFICIILSWSSRRRDMPKGSLKRDFTEIKKLVKNEISKFFKSSKTI